MGNHDHILAIDIVILVAAALYCVVSLRYIAAMWSMRRNFFIVLRSPRLACAIGLCFTLRYTILTFGCAIKRGHSASIEEAEYVTLMKFPVLIIAEIALVMTAVRLLVMFFPKIRAKWGRFTREKYLVRGLACAYLGAEVTAWSAAAAQGMPRIARALTRIERFSGVITIAAALFLGSPLKRVDDLLHMSRDIYVVGMLLLLMICLEAGLRFVPMSPNERKYCNVGFLAVTHPPITWIINIRPVREVLRHIPAIKRTNAGLYLMSTPVRKRSSLTRIGVTADFEISQPAQGGREECVDANRLTKIMSFQPLRDAFGDFCRRSLCTESFQFLVDVSEFKDLLAEVGGESEKGFGGFGGYQAIVNDYIKDGSHWEVNIESKTKRDIMRHTRFKDYASLNLDERRDLFAQAEREINTVLADNLLNKFLVSDPYKKVVDFEGLTHN